MPIPIYDPSPEIAVLRKKIDKAISDVLDHGQFILGPEVDEFELNAATYLSVEHAIGVNSGTDALRIALESMGIGPGDEVITTPMSYIATAESISHTGARPVFVDIEEHSFNIDPEKIEPEINNQTKAILPVHLFGQPANMQRITEIAQQYNLLVLEDCAQSFGASISIPGNTTKKHTGNIGNAAAFSFFPTKNLGGIGDGGLITTYDNAIAEKARMLRVHGARKKYYNERLGYNSRLDTIQAAVLNIKLAHIDEFNQKRRDVATFYDKGLNNIDEIQCPVITEDHIFHQYTIQVLDNRRDELRNFLKENGISTNIYFPIPINEMEVYKNENYPVLPVTHRFAKQTLSLPMWPYIQKEALQIIVAAVKRFFIR